MNAAAACLGVAFGLTTSAALAQAGGDAMQKLHACAQLPQAERLECLDKLSRDIGAPSPSQPAASEAPRPAPTPPPRTAPAADAWVVSETTSPLDYSPIAIATASSGALQLLIQCRGGRTELVIAGATLARRVEEYVVSYAVDDGRPVTVAAGTPASGSGVAVKGDVVRLLASLPERGDVAFRVTHRQDGELEGRFALAALKSLLKRLAVPCKWPAGAPRNR